MTTLEILKAARELISVPERWCQNSFARTSLGTPVGPYDGLAARFCVRGAIRKVCEPMLGQGVYFAEVAVGRQVDPDSMVPDWELSKFNDEHEHADVMAAIDRAIARLSSPDSERGRDG